MFTSLPYGNGHLAGEEPEIILSGEKGRMAYSCAGRNTAHGNEGTAEFWDEKNKREQQLVSNYIHDQLGSLGIELTMEGPIRHVPGLYVI